MLRRLKFFHEFSHAEIWEVLRASSWQDYAAGEEIVKEGEMDDRFYILVTGGCVVERHGKSIGALGTGDCFGEASYVPGAKRTATIRAAGEVTVLKVSSTLLEQVSASCQLRFNRVFLSTLIARLQSAERVPPPPLRQAPLQRRRACAPRAAPPTLSCPCTCCSSKMTLKPRAFS